jgi:RNA polymerase sigma factor (sigma-70 family)
MTDSELLRHYAREGKQEAFQEFVRRHVDLVYGAARRRLGGSVHRAQDVTQTVFTDAAKKAERLAGHPAMTGWLYTSAYRAAAALMRAEDRRERREREAATMNQIDAMSAGKVAGLDTTLLAAIEHAVMELPERDREAVLMRFLEQRRFAEIGAALRVSEDAARVRVDRALVRLRARLGQIGITSSAAALAATLEAAPGVAPAPAELVVVIAQQAANATVSAPLAGILTWGIGMAALAVTATGSYKALRQHRRLESALTAPAIVQTASLGRRQGPAGRATQLSAVAPAHSVADASAAIIVRQH